MTFDTAVPPLEKVCIKCEEKYELEFFARCLTRQTTAETRRPVCMGCEQTARDEKKQRDRMLQKIRGTIRRHARKLRISRERLVHHYGWTVDKLRQDALDAYEHKGCAYCDKPFLKAETMGDLTLDIVNPRDEPWYSYNVKWICNVCNRLKQLAAPAIFAIRLAMWKRWRARQVVMKAAPPPPPLPPEPSQQWLLPELAPA